jgi:hypothetical protein
MSSHITYSMPNANRTDILCRVCSLPCATSPAKQLGIHISCVQEAEMRYKHVRIQTPRYRGAGSG